MPITCGALTPPGGRRPNTRPRRCSISGFSGVVGTTTSADPTLRAVDRARAMDDPAALARTLNRLGNVHANREEIDQALRYHQEALEIFTGWRSPVVWPKRST